MEGSVIDEFLLVMIATFLKELLHMEIFNTSKERVKRLSKAYPCAMPVGWACSIAFSLYLVWVSFPAATAGFLAALAWETIMPPLTKRP